MEMKLKSVNMRTTPHLSLMALKNHLQPLCVISVELFSIISGLKLDNKTQRYFGLALALVVKINSIPKRI